MRGGESWVMNDTAAVPWFSGLFRRRCRSLDVLPSKPTAPLVGVGRRPESATVPLCEWWTIPLGDWVVLSHQSCGKCWWMP